MKKILFIVLTCLNVLAFAGCNHSADKKNPDKDKGPIYMRPIHHSKDTAQA